MIAQFIYNLVLLSFTFYALAKLVDIFFIEALEVISKKLKLSSDIAGATFMAIGSSAPELFVSFFALFRPTGGEQAIGAGTIVGSAIFNILVIVGVSALYRRAYLTWQPVVRDLSFYILTILVLLLTFMDGKITILDSLLFISLYIAYLFSFKYWKKYLPYETKGDIDKEVLQDIVSERSLLAKQNVKIKNIFPKLLSLFFFDLTKRDKKVYLNFFIAVLFLAGLSHLMVESAVSIAHILNISEVIIGLTILAAGTSVPDLLSSISVAKKGQGDMAVANAVGSNIFDIAIGLGLPWLIYTLYFKQEITVATESLSSSIMLLFATVIALLFLLVARKWELGRYAGVLLIGGYLFYILSQMGLISTEFCLYVGGSYCVNI